MSTAEDLLARPRLEYRRRRRWVSLFLLLWAASVIVAYGPSTEPILGDRAYFVYLSQAVLRGEPIYDTTFIGYPPLGPLLGAAAMAIGRVVDVPTYLAPRFVGALVFVLSVWLAGRVATRITGSRWTGAGAGLVLAGISHFGSLSVSGLEPKSLVVLFSLATAHAIQCRRWGLAGLFAGLAGMCYQPAVLVAFSTFPVVLKAGRRRLLPTLTRYACGMFVGLLPAILYVSLTDTWAGFIRRAITLPMETSLHGSGSPLHWLKIAGHNFGNEIAFFWAAALGLLVFAARRLRGHRPGWLSARMGGFPLLALAWIWLFSRDFQGPVDMIGCLGVLAVFAALGGHYALLGLRRLASSAGRSSAPRMASVASGVLLFATASYGAADAWLYEPGIRLEDQVALVRRITKEMGADDVVSFEATEVYVFSDRRSPMPFLSMNRYYVPFLDLVGFDDCTDLQETLLADRPRVVVIRDWAWQSQCVYSLGRLLRANGYARTLEVLGERRHRSYFPDDRNLRRVRWDVYRAGKKRK